MEDDSLPREAEKPAHISETFFVISDPTLDMLTLLAFSIYTLGSKGSNLKRATSASGFIYTPRFKRG